MHGVERTGIPGVCVVHYTKENKHMKDEKNNSANNCQVVLAVRTVGQSAERRIFLPG
jgi:hypothetical protein